MMICRVSVYSPLIKIFPVNWFIAWAFSQPW